MKTFFGIHQIKEKFSSPAVAIGVFDGLHAGHQKLIKKSVKWAQKNGGTSIVMTFSPHPVHVLRPEIRLPMIISLKHRLHLMEGYGVDAAVVIKFTKRFAKISPEFFIKEYLVKKIGVKQVIVGEDFRFGQDRTGTISLFENFGARYGFNVRAVDAFVKGVKTVSSSRIRELIEKGNLKKSKELLGRPVSILGTVIRGDGRGKRLGYPTANILSPDELFPPAGVYQVTVYVDGQRYYAMANIGSRPTFVSQKKQLLEVHLLGFSGNLYGKEILVEFIKKIREEKKFASKEKFLIQLKKDEEKTRRFFRL